MIVHEMHGILEHELIILPQCAALCGSYRNEFPQEKKTFDDSRRHKAVGRPKNPSGGHNVSHLVEVHCKCIRPFYGGFTL